MSELDNLKDSPQRMRVYNARMSDPVRPAAVLVKGFLLFLSVEFALASLAPGIGMVNAYAALHMLRPRFPISTRSPVDAASDVGNLEAMFASHVVARPKAADEFRLMVFGDSAMWGLQLRAEQTMPAQLDGLGLSCDGKIVRAYNLSIPKSSATKDLMILDQALHYQPDMLVWVVTWYTLMPKTRLDHFLINQNPEEFYKLGRRFDFLPNGFLAPTLMDDLYAENRALFRIARYQLYPLIQLSTGVDQLLSVPLDVSDELSADPTFEGLKPPTLRDRQVSLDQVQDFYKLAGSIPVVLVNEPIKVITGVPNSDIRYNNYYPRWVYDQYRQYLGQAAALNHWNYLDLWKVFPPEYFEDTPLHLIPKAHHLLAEMLAPVIEKNCQ